MAVVLVFLGLVAALAAAPARQKIRIGVEDNSPPMSFVDAQGRPAGFTAELLQAMGETGDVEFEVVASAWTYILQEFNAGRLDALANVAILPERRATMDFSVGHAYLHAVAFTRPEGPKIRKARDLAGLRIAVVNGSLSYLHAADENAWGGELHPLPSRQATYEAVRDGACDVALHMRPSREEVAEKLGLRTRLVEDVNYTFHIAVHKGDAVRLEQINQALAIVLRDEKFDTLYARWIGPLQPRDLRWVDVRPYALPIGLGLFAIAVLIAWQQHVIRLRTRAEATLRVSEARFRSVVEAMAEGMVLQDADGRIVASNRAASLIQGRADAEMAGRDSNDPTWGAVHEDGTPFPGDAHPAMVTLRTGAPQEHVVMGIRRADGERRWISINAQPIVTAPGSAPSAVVATFHDITEDKRKEQEIRRLNRLYATISRVNYAMVQNRERDALLHEVCRILVEVGGFRIAWVAFHDASTGYLKPSAVFGDDSDYVSRTGISADESRPEGRGPTGIAFRTGQPYICNDFYADPGTAPWRERARASGIQSSATLPIRVEGRVEGTLVVYSAELGYFGAEQVKLLEETARDLSYALGALASEERRQRSEGMLATVLNTVPQAVFWKDRNSVYLGCNESFARFAGLAQAADIVGRTDFDLPWRREESELFRRDDAEVMDTRRVKLRIQEQILTAAGEQLWLETSKMPLLDANGQVYGVLGVFDDITEQKSINDALAESRAQTLAIINSSEDIIWSMDARSLRVTAFNEAFRQYFQESRGIAIQVGMTPEEIMPAEYAARWRNRFAQVLREGSISFEHEAILQGRVFWVVLNAMKRDGVPFGIAVFARDVTERRRTETKLRQLSRIVEQSQLSVVITDLDGKIEYVNPKFCAVTGYAAAEVLGRNTRLLKSGTTPPEVYREMWQTLQRGETWIGDLYNRKKDGEIFLEALVIAPVLDSDGRPTHYVSLRDDITARKRFEAESQARLQREHEISEMKSRFISIVSHEFRTPLAAVRVSSDILRRHFALLDARQREDLFGRIEGSVHQLTTMLDEILLLNRIDADRFVVRVVPTNLRQLVSDIMEEHRLADHGAHRFEFFATGRDDEFPTDTSAFRHILSNLLGNALKYSAPQTIVTVRLDADAARAVVTVEDRGLGLPVELIPKIFEPFERGANAGSVKGTGLGLNIAKRMADLIGGTITAENRADGGARFTVVLPRGGANHPPPSS